MYKEMKKIVEVGNKHGNGDGFGLNNKLWTLDL
jgi:hypothetical protein